MEWYRDAWLLVTKPNWKNGVCICTRPKKHEIFSFVEGQSGQMLKVNRAKCYVTSKFPIRLRLGEQANSMKFRNFQWNFIHFRNFQWNFIHGLVVALVVGERWSDSDYYYYPMYLSVTVITNRYQHGRLKTTRRSQEGTQTGSCLIAKP